MVDTSSFFWLGLVGSVLFGLILTALRTRNSQRNAGLHRATSPSQAKPELWDAYIVLDKHMEAYAKEAMKSCRTWNSELPLSVHVIPRPSNSDNNPSKGLPPTMDPQSFFHRLRRPTQTAADPAPVDNAQVSAVILFPYPQRSVPRPSIDKDIMKDEGQDVTIPCEYAVGTVTVSYRAH